MSDVVIREAWTMLMFAAALIPAASLPAPAAPVAYVISVLPSGGFRLTVARLAAERLDEARAMLDDAAAKNCGARTVVPGDESYNQATDAHGNPAAEITELSETFTCT
jgi:hypothetical protein